MSRFRAGNGREARDLRDHSAQTERRPVDILAEQMKLAQWARQGLDWTGYEHARDTAIRLAVSHRIEDEISRYRQVTTACTGWQEWGEDARALIMKRLAGVFMESIDHRESPHNVIVRMQRIPRAQATSVLVSELRRGDGEQCIRFLLSVDGHIADDVRGAFGDDPAQIASTLTERDWATFIKPLMTIAPGELREDLIAGARDSLRRVLSELPPLEASVTPSRSAVR